VMKRESPRVAFGAGVLQGVVGAKHEQAGKAQPGPGAQ
jgi:hypothetical protein